LNFYDAELKMCQLWRSQYFDHLALKFDPLWTNKIHKYQNGLEIENQLKRLGKTLNMVVQSDKSRS